MLNHHLPVDNMEALKKRSPVSRHLESSRNLATLYRARSKGKQTGNVNNQTFSAVRSTRVDEGRDLARIRRLCYTARHVISALRRKHHTSLIWKFYEYLDQKHFLL